LRKPLKRHVRARTCYSKLSCQWQLHLLNSAVASCRNDGEGQRRLGYSLAPKKRLQKTMMRARLSSGTCRAGWEGRLDGNASVFSFPHTSSRCELIPKWKWGDRTWISVLQFCSILTREMYNSGSSVRWCNMGRCKCNGDQFVEIAVSEMNHSCTTAAAPATGKARTENNIVRLFWHSQFSLRSIESSITSRVLKLSL
jgi:hypothetical protein